MLDSYLITRINDYIFLEYYKWDISENLLMELVNMKDINILKKIMEYDYEIFLTRFVNLLFSVVNIRVGEGGKVEYEYCC